VRANLSSQQIKTAYKILTFIHYYTTFAITYITTLTSTLTGFSPSLASLLLLVVILFFSLQILNMLWKWITWWVNLALRIAFWGGLATLAVWMWTRGPEGFFEDVQDLVEYWSAEYDRFREQAHMARIERRMKNRGRRREGWY
jgi:hypothetical protein